MTEEQKKILDNEYHWQQVELGKKQVEQWQKEPMTYEEFCEMLIKAKIKSGLPVEDYLLKAIEKSNPQTYEQLKAQIEEQQARKREQKKKRMEAESQKKEK